MSSRSTGRAEILDAANTNRIRTDPYRMRHVQEAVFRLRQRGTAKGSVLVMAGFSDKPARPGGRPAGKPGRPTIAGYPRPRKRHR